MKPIELVISGLNSFRQEQIIDFNLLSDTGLFGIFGPTGSGKSSILDAITLCLYGRVERSDVNRVGIINQQEEKTHVKFTFELALDNNRQRYYVERVYNRLDQLRVRSALARLVRVDAEQEIVIADKEKEVTKAVEELLGLTVDDFTRAVVLPQGKFAEFLTLKAQDRRPMLERLFHLDEYGKKLKDKSQRKENELKQQRDELLTKQAMLSHATKENIAEIEQKIELGNSKKQDLAKSYDQFLIFFKNIERVWGIQAELAEIKAQLKDMEEKEGYISLIKLKKENAEKAAIIEPTLKNYRKLEAQLDDLNQTIVALTIKYQNLLGEVNEDKQVYEESKKNHDKYFPILTDKKYKLQEALEYEKEINSLQNSIDSNARDKEVLLIKQTEFKDQLEQFEKAVNSLTADITSIKDNLEKIQITSEERKQLDNALQVRQSLLQCKNDIITKNAELELLKSRIVAKEQLVQEQHQQIELTTKEYQELEQKLADLLNGSYSNDDWLIAEKALFEREHLITKINEHQQELIKLQIDKEQVENKIVAIGTQISEIRLQITSNEELILKNRTVLNDLEKHQKINIAVKLSQDLKDGKPCIVCGSTHHPDPKTEEHLDITSEQEINQLNKQLAELEAELMKNKIELKTAENNLKAQEEQRAKLNNEIESRDIQLKELIKRLPVDFQELQIEELSAKIEQDKEQQQQLKKEIEAINSQNEELGALVKTIKEQLANQQNAYKLTMSELDMLNEQNITITAVINEFTEKLVVIQSKWENSKNGWELDTIEQVKAEIEQMDLKREKLQDDLKKLEGALEENKQKYNDASAKKQILENQLSVIEINLKKDLDTLEKLTEKYNSITDGKRADTLLAEIANKLQDLNEKLVNSEKQLQTKTSELNQAENSLNSNKAVLTNLQNQHLEVKEQLTLMLKNYKFSSIKDLNEYLLSNEEIEKLAREIKAYESNLNLLLNKKDELVNKINGNELSKEDWNKHNEEKSQLEAELEESKNHLNELTFHYKELKKDYEVWKELEANRKSIQQELDIASELNQVLRGNGFIDFVAQEYLYNITIIASSKLKQLTRNRYSLDIDQDGGFKLIDELNGGLSRPVQSLSGGETFLTSLSLALALSSQIQLKGGQMLEFFFLDEGFGSLDSDLLDTVMMTFEKLHAGHMLIGIISHVPELQSRINRKIIVVPADTKGNGSSIRVEYS